MASRRSNSNHPRTPTLPGLGATLEFGGVKLKPMNTGKGGWGGFMASKSGTGNRQGSFWGPDKEAKGNPMAKRKSLPPRRKDGAFRKRRSGKKRK